MTAEQQVRLRERLAKLKRLSLLGGTGLSTDLERLEEQLERMDAEVTDEEIWRSVELARHPERPYTLDYVARLFDDFVELHGDRGRADDQALVTGIGRFRDRTVALIGHQKGRDLKERTQRNFGMAYPEGYRKAMRVMELAGRHDFPLLTLVDTPGAYPGVSAEQHGQGGAIARSQAVLARLGVPIVSCIIGEGGSGGAIAIAVADRVLMQENAIYSVISPEGCAAILWRDAARRGRPLRHSNRTPRTGSSWESWTGSSPSPKAELIPTSMRPLSSSSRAFSLHSRKSTTSTTTIGGVCVVRSTA